MRAAAVLAVLAYHTWLYSAEGSDPVDLGSLSRFVLPHLPVGVTLFFTLSGFLLYRPIVASIMAGRHPQPIGRYLRNRALRIVPAYWAILLATGVLLPATLVRAGDELRLGRLIEDPAQLLLNVSFLQNYFARSMDTGIPPAWSLAVEVVFYIVLPFLGLLAGLLAVRARGWRGRTVAVMVPPVMLFGVGAVTAFVWTSLLRGGGGSVLDGLGRSFLNHADLFASGMGLAVLMVGLESERIRLPRWWRAGAAVLFVALALTAVLLVDRGVIYLYRGAVVYELLTGAAAVLFVALVVLPTSGTSLLTRVFEGRILVAIGVISYSLFLWHEPLVRLADERRLTLGGARGYWWNLLILGSVSVALSVATYRFIERPALARKADQVPSVSQQEPARPRGDEHALEAR